MTPFVVGRDPWNREAMRLDAFTHGLWQFRAGTGNFAWAGIDMALWDVCGRRPGSRCGGCSAGCSERGDVLLLPRARARDSVAAQVADGLARDMRSSTSRSGLTTMTIWRWSPPCARRSVQARGCASMRTAAGHSRRRFACSTHWLSTTSTSSSNRYATTCRPPCRAAQTDSDNCLCERGAVVGGRRVRADPRSAGRRLLLLALLGRLDLGLPPARVGRGA